MESLVELLAENTHNVWARERIQQGWTYGLSEVLILRSCLGMRLTITYKYSIQAHEFVHVKIYQQITALYNTSESFNELIICSLNANRIRLLNVVRI